MIFTLAMGWHNFWLAIAGEVLHGLGSGTVMVAMRAVVSKFFLDNELTFALVRGFETRTPVEDFGTYRWLACFL